MLKQDVINTIDSLPENVTIEDIMYRLYIMGKQKKSLADIDAGRVYGTDEIRQSMKIRPYLLRR